MYADKQEIKEQIEFCQGCKFLENQAGVEEDYYNGPDLVCNCEGKCPREK